MKCVIFTLLKTSKNVMMKNQKTRKYWKLSRVLLLQAGNIHRQFRYGKTPLISFSIEVLSSHEVAKLTRVKKLR
jgi:hypothetical protein